MKRALIAMSGGVDSSVAALKLLGEGCDCVGVTMRLYRNSDLGLACHKSCCAESDAEDAEFVCSQLGIPHELLDYTGLFRVQVIQRFADEYARGRTPNPCVDCNRRMKFEALLDEALDRGEMTRRPSGHPPQGRCFEAAITGARGYETGVTIGVTPVLSLGFWGAKSDARYNCGHQKTCPTNGNYASSVPSKAWFST